MNRSKAGAPYGAAEPDYCPNPENKKMHGFRPFRYLPLLNFDWWQFE